MEGERLLTPDGFKIELWCAKRMHTSAAALHSKHYEGCHAC
jgi:hypothetical protein